ncbi:MAG TPA: nitrate- and nitrite sensing domain-containing protein [Acidimicrobiales bacterium]|nr:nitrate- and nitrite sensing domain-containing protein [Acidimicrobiales bacterium]
MKVGTKLLAVTVPPLLVLMALAGVGLAERRAQAEDARSVARGAELVAASSALADGLQAERTASMISLSERAPDDAAETLDGLRPATSAALDRFEEATDAVVSGGAAPDLTTAIERTRTRTDDLDTIRAQVDAGNLSVFVAEAWFSDTLRTLTAMNAEVATTTAVPEVSDDLSTVAALERSREAQARGASTLAFVLTDGLLDPEGRQWRVLTSSLQETQGYLALTYEIAEPSQAATLRNRLAAPAVTAADAVIDQVLVTALGGLDPQSGAATGPPVRLRLDPGPWIESADATRAAMALTGTEILDGVTATADGIVDDAVREALLYALAVAGAVIVSALVAVVVARRTSRPLRELTVAAERLSVEQLPALVEQLRSPRPETAPAVLEPIAMDRADEIGQLARAFDAVQRVTVDVAEEQAALLRRGIGDIFVNLARRNQALLDRQIEFIDHLEAGEEDPDVLEDLFKLDHLATRMRRNAESLLVLAGADPAHRRARPVPLADVVRVAIGEVEDFARLKLLALDAAIVSGAEAVDLAHLLAELMENATQFSPPDTRVEILGHRARDGGYVVSVSDQGLGMSEDQLAESNQLLADPPLVGLALSRSLGFTVVGRLAARFGIGVRLTTSPAGGVTALVTLPATVLAEGPTAEHEGGSTPVAPLAVVRSEEPAPSSPVRDHRTTPAPTPVVPPPTIIPDSPARLSEALPQGEAFDAGLASLLPRRESAAPPAAGAAEPAVPGALPRRVTARPPAEADTTSAGLARRTPGAVSAPNGSDEHRAATAPTRSPEEVRAMLARYRSGLHAGRNGRPTGDAAPTEPQGGQR